MEHLRELSAYAKVEKHPLLPDFYILTLNVDNRMQEFQLSRRALGELTRVLHKQFTDEFVARIDSFLSQRLPASTDPTP